ncbi:hypothetical protein ACLD11_00240 [Salmonella sp. 741265116_PST]|uniref:hypothetical protein n=1 Tax=Salmonella sp. 741265116_PST TaxID=3389067 RepID=UPI0039817856
MRISEEGWRLLTFWMFTAGSYLILFFIVICLAFLFQTPRRVLLWIALPQITLVLLLWFAAGDETLFFPIGAGWILGLSLLLALLFSHRLRQPHHLWAGGHVVVLLLLLAHMGDILERHHRRDAYQAQQAAEETLLRKIDTTDDRAFLNHLMSQAMQPQNAGDWWTNRRIEHLANAFPLLILRTELKKFGWFWLSTGLIVLLLGRLPPGLLAILYRQSNIGISFYKTIHYWTY